MLRIEIRGSTFLLLSQRALYWEEEKILICSDLHWGRELLMQKFGMPIPERSFERETLLLEDIFAITGAKEWWILGDLIHHPLALDWDLIKRMNAWMLTQLEAQLDVIRFVPGNHDRSFKSWSHYFPFVVEPNGIFRKDFGFLHEPSSSLPNDLFYWYGHLHPAVRPPMLGLQKFPCFWIRENHGFLPAFSRLAGGCEIRPDQADSVFAIADQQVVRIY